MSSRFSSSFELGDVVVERNTGVARKRVGEIVFMTEGKRPKLRLVELAPRSLSPKYNGNYSKLRYFTTPPENCRRLNIINIKKSKIFQLGDVIRHRRYGTFRFGIIVGFHHPDGLYSDSWEKGYNGKDIIECVEISGRSGLPDVPFPSVVPPGQIIGELEKSHRSRWGLGHSVKIVSGATEGKGTSGK